MDRSSLVHGALAAAASVAAYFAWVEPAQTTDDQSVVAVAGSAERLTEVSWEEESLTVNVAREGDAAVVTVTPKAKKVQAPEAPAAESALPPKRYPATEKAQELFKSLAPLKATRSLGRPDDEKRKALGLAPAVSTLRLGFGGEVRAVAVGNATFGSGSLYAQPEGGDVYLLPSNAVQNLRAGATPLIERFIVGVPREKLTRIVVTVGGKVREFVQRDGEDRAKAYFADPADPDTKLEKAGEWLDRVVRLRLSEFAAEAPRGEPALVAELWGEKELLEELKLWRGGDKDGVATCKRFKSPVVVAKPTLDPIFDQFEAVASEGK